MAIFPRLRRQDEARPLQPPPLYYHNVVIRQRDIETLREGQWLNDTILELHMELLDRNLRLTDSKVLLLRPSVLQVIASVNDLVYLKFNTLPPDFQSQQVYFIPINDARLGAGYTGSHWSLLVFIRTHHTFYYYDSLLGHNITEAQTMARRITSLLNLQAQPPLFQIIDTPAQHNAADCGVYVMAITEKLVQRLLRQGSLVSNKKKLARISRRSIASGVNHKREDIIKFIWNLRAAQFPPPPLSPTEQILRKFFGPSETL